MGSYNDIIIAEFADDLCNIITRKTIKYLQSIKDTMSADESGLNNAWDEICVQLRDEKSFYWHVYELEIRRKLEYEIQRLKKYQLKAIWLQTYQFEEWINDDEADHDSIPFWEDDIVEYIMEHFIYSATMDYMNNRIRTYLENHYLL